MALPIQITKIKIAQKELNITDDNYRLFLAHWGVKSCTKLTVEQANEALKRLEEMGWVPKRTTKKARTSGRNYQDYNARSSDFAAPQQLRLVEVLWKIVARYPSPKTLESFIYRQTKIRKLEWLKKNHVEAVLCALEDMYRNTSLDQIASRTDMMIPRDQQFAKENLIPIRGVKHG